MMLVGKSLKRVVKLVLQLVHLNATNSHILLSFPKSGSTVLRFRLAKLLRQEQINSHADISDVCPELGSNAGGLFGQVYKTHNIKIVGLVNGNSKIIHLIRDPEKALKSYYLYMRKLQNYSKDFKIFLDSRIGIKYYEKHLAFAESNRENDNYLLIKFDRLLTSKEEVMRDISNFIGLDIADIDKLMNETTREAMRDLERGTSLEGFSDIKDYHVVYPEDYHSSLSWLSSRYTNL